MSWEGNRWEAFEYEGQWFLISPTRGASDGPMSKEDAETRAKNLNRDMDVQAAARAAFAAQENE